MKIAFLAAMLIFPITAVSAQTPVEQWPYRMVVSGPATARAGSEVTYRVEYTLIDPDAIESPAFVFNWPYQGVELVSSHVVDGPDGVMGMQTERSVRWDFSQVIQSGAVEVVLELGPDASGDIGVGIYLLGTGLTLPPGSVESVTTRVEAPEAALPSTGTGAVAETGAMPAVMLALAGVALLACGAALRNRVPR